MANEISDLIFQHNTLFSVYCLQSSRLKFISERLLKSERPHITQILFEFHLLCCLGFRTAIILLSRVVVLLRIAKV